MPLCKHAGACLGKVDKANQSYISAHFASHYIPMFGRSPIIYIWSQRPDMTILLTETYNNKSKK